MEAPRREGSGNIKVRKQMVLGVVIPVYHGAATIGGVVNELTGSLESLRMDYQVLLVADGGGQDDEDAVRRLTGRRVSALVLQRNVGQQKALYLGIRRLGGCGMIATMDDDGAHPVEMLSAMMDAVHAGADLCYAVPVRLTRSPFRRLGAFCRDALFALCLGLPRKTRVSAYRVMTGELAGSLTPEPDGYIYLSAAAMKRKPKVACLRYRAQPAGPSRYTPKKLMRLYGGLLTHYTPLKRLAFRHKMVGNAAAQGRESPWEP